VNTVSKSADPLTRDRGFESGSIQRGVRCERGWKPSESKKRVGTFNGIGDHPLLGGRPAERRFTVGGSGKSVARCHRTVLAYWKFESISLQRRVRLYPAFAFEGWLSARVVRGWLGDRVGRARQHVE
jgi:hypothetical protein